MQEHSWGKTYPNLGDYLVNIFKWDALGGEDFFTNDEKAMFLKEVSNTIRDKGWYGGDIAVDDTTCTLKEDWDAWGKIENNLWTSRTSQILRYWNLSNLDIEEVSTEEMKYGDENPRIKLNVSKGDGLEVTCKGRSNKMDR